MWGKLKSKGTTKVTNSGKIKSNKMNTEKGRSRRKRRSKRMRRKITVFTVVCMTIFQKMITEQN
jgi:hypothetical protein